MGNGGRIVKPKGLAPENCHNEYIRAMLVPYAERSLAKSNCAEVEAHLAECPLCKEDVRALRELMRPLNELSKGGYKPLFDGHLSHEQLFKYAMHYSSQTPEEARRIRLHLLLCRACREELELIKQVDRDFRELNVGDSLKWTLPPVLRNLVAPHKRLEAAAEADSTPVGLSWEERLQDVSQKLNLRLAVIICLVVLVIVGGLLFMMCSPEEQAGPQVERPTTVTPVPKVTVQPLTAAWVALPLIDVDRQRALQELQNQKISYRMRGETLEVNKSQRQAAQEILARLAGSSPTPQASATPLEESSPTPLASEESSQSEAAPEVIEETTPVPSQEEPAAAPEPQEVYTEPEPEPEPAPEPQPAPQPEPEPPVEEAPAPPPAPQPEVKETPKFTQPRIPAPPQVKAPIHSATPQPQVEAPSRPKRTYTEPGFQAAPAPSPVQAEPSRPVNRPTPIAAPAVRSPQVSPAAPKEKSAEPPVLKVDESLAPARAEVPSVEVAPATIEPPPSGHNFQSGGDTYNEADSVTSRETIE